MGFDEVIGEVRRLLHRTPFERVEAFIEQQLQLSEEERAVAWLIAWFDGDAPSLTEELGRIRVYRE